ncbi:MAG: hypothetical protein R3D35_16210 [Nitratireductor sp.]
MKAMLFAFVALVVISVGANLVLDGMGFSSAENNTSAAVRLDN